MATAKSKGYLIDKFEDGDRPTGENFAELIESSLNKVDDNVNLDANGNLTIPGGINVSNVATGVNGTLRFNDGTGTMEVFFGGTWNPIGGGGGAFTEVNGGPNVAFNGGSVGIGTAANTPVARLEIPLAANSPAQRVRLGNLIVHNGSGNNAAFVAHFNRFQDTDFALRQENNGNTTVNVPANAQMFFSQGGTSRMIIDSGGNLLIGVNTSIQGNLTVTGNVTTNGNFIDTTPSDALVKEDVKNLNWGLTELLKLKPVFYKYNGMGGTPTDGKERIGLIAQDVEAVFPSLVSRSRTSDPSAEYILSYESQPLLYVMMNAVRELADRVEKLECVLYGNSSGKE
jgi:hypothetical protein